MASGYVKRLLGDPRDRLSLLKRYLINPGDFLKNRLTNNKQRNAQNYEHVASADRVSYFDLRESGSVTNCLDLHIETAQLSTQFQSSSHFKTLRPLFYLPYRQNGITRMHLAPPAGYHGDEIRFFATAAINGCSVYIEGPAATPKVMHLNAENVQPTLVTDTYRDKEPKIQAKIADMDIRANAVRKGASTVVERPKYMVEKPSVLLEHRQLFAHTKGINVTDVTLTAPQGSVIGVKDGATWTFYFQRALIFTYRVGGQIGVQQQEACIAAADQVWPSGQGIFRMLR
jgi:hypothetical protein